MASQAVEVLRFVSPAQGKPCRSSPFRANKATEPGVFDEMVGVPQEIRTKAPQVLYDARTST